ncbi:long-chain fatty acid--CoA ligase [Streptomyces verrucosisporus]|uniref:AMP-dependent synthetase/ligase n=1 Tax=Streptomyces verrucosisporus TaxID=1695161 RepID=UPI0019D163D5|nr:AMP-dependent synthetase/ligase [Streptomyces verrucosisporus]MBN3929436.1 long-chain fatty acid--CoA ligase [Streptomyces verrucosisporus]
MRDFSLPPVVEPMRKGGLADSVHELAERDPHFAQLARRADPAGGDPAGGDPAGGEWATVTAAAFRDEVRALAKGLLADGIRFDDRVAVMARTRYEWTLFSYALWTIGAQVVPVYPTSSAEQVRWILADAQVAAVVVEHEEHAMTVGSVCDAAPSLRRIWQLDTGCLRELTELGRGVPDDLVDRHRLAVTPRSVAAVTYTSGTTGRPKGCVITHANLAAECDILLAGWPGLIAAQGERPAILAFLPLSHIYGLMVQVFCVRNGVLLGHQPEIAPAELLPALASFRPTFVFAVPYVFEKIYRKARQAALEAGKGEVFDRAMDVAVRYAEAVERRDAGTGPGPGAVLRASHAVFERTVYRKLRAVLGGRVRYAVSGGSTLRRELGLIFAGAGITVYDGYGLTETTAAVTGQPMGRVKFGTVGRPMPGHSIHIARDGEIWVHGDVVFAGYLNNPEATAGVLRDGWFATGDVGHLDDEGYLVITGRKKDIIITSGGKSVAPQVLEDRVRAHPLISQCLVVGDDRPYVAALVTLDPEALEQWFRLREREPLSPREVLRDEELHAEVQRAVSQANNAVSRAESIRAFRILPAEFSMREGLVTPSLKMRRAAIAKMYEAEIDALYSS